MRELMLARKHALKKYFNDVEDDGYKVNKKFYSVIDDLDTEGIKPEFSGLNKYEIADRVVQDTSANVDLIKEVLNDWSE